MYGRFQADNFFVTTITGDQTLVPGEDGVLNVSDLPNIEDGKLFYAIFRVDNIDNRFTLPIYKEGGQLKYKGYNVKAQKELIKYDTVSMNDLAENFNYVFGNIDDIGTIVKKGGLDILVYGGNIIRGGINVVISDVDLTMDDNSTQYIVFDFSDSTIKAVTILDNLSHYCFAEVTTFGGEITNITSKKSFNGGEIFSNVFFERNNSTGAIQIKNNAIKKANIDLTGITTDDIPEGQENKYFTNPENYQTKTNLKQDLNNPSATTYPSTQAVVDALEEAGAGDMTKATYDPNNKRADVFNMDNMTNGNTNKYVIKQSTAPTDPTQGTIWFDTTTNILKLYNGSSWETAGDGDMAKATYDPNNKNANAFDMDNMTNGSNNKFVIKNSSTPANPVDGMVWYDTTNDVLKIYNGSSWDEVGADCTNTKVFRLSGVGTSQTVLAEGQAIYDYYAAGGFPFIVYQQQIYGFANGSSTDVYFHSDLERPVPGNTITDFKMYGLVLTISDGQVTQVYTTTANMGRYLATDQDYSEPFMPTYAGSPATKKYVDSKTATVSTTAPSNPTEGMLWYDSTNHVLKVYNGTNWVAVGSTPGDASSSTKGVVKLGSDTVQSESAQTVSSTVNRTYAVQNNSSGQMVVNVPREDHNTTYNDATSSAAGLVKLGSDTQQNESAQTVSSTTGRTYAIQKNSSGQMVVNVPWEKGGDVDYNDFVLASASITGGTVFISNLTERIIPSQNFSISCANNIKPGMQYILRVMSDSTAYTMSLDNAHIANPFNEALTLTANKTTTLVFFATSESSLELFSARTEA